MKFERILFILIHVFLRHILGGLGLLYVQRSPLEALVCRLDQMGDSPII